jgi:hypothetical protein
MSSMSTTSIPADGARVPSRKESLIRWFGAYRDCVTSTAKSGKDLLGGTIEWHRAGRVR